MERPNTGVVSGGVIIASESCNKAFYETLNVIHGGFHYPQVWPDTEPDFKGQRSL